MLANRDRLIEDNHYDTYILYIIYHGAAAHYKSILARR